MTARTVPGRTRLAALLLLPLLLIGGCSALVPTADIGRSPSDVRTEPASGGDAAAPMVPSDTSGAEVDTAERQVARSASMTVTVPALLPAADGVRQLATSLGGWVVQEDLALATEPGWPTYSVVTFSVPEDRLDEALERVSQLGTVTQRSASAVDVTEPVQDIDARIRTLEASIARVSELMVRAGTVTEIAQVERELSERQAQLESLRAERERLRTAVERATVSVELQTPQQSVKTNPILTGLARGWDAFLASIALLLTVVGAVLPFALVLALVGVPAVWWWRRRHPRAPRTPDAADTTRPADGGE